MAPRITREDLLQSLRHYQNENVVLRWFLASLAPSAGFHFQPSPRHHGAWILFVDEEGNVGIYDVGSMDSQKRAQWTHEMTRAYEKTVHYESLLDTLHAAAKWRNAA